MKIAVIGAGGVGGYIGAYLLRSQTEHEITLVARGAHQKAIASDGLRIIQDEEEFSVKVENMNLAGIYDIVIFATKSYDLMDAIKLVRPYVSKSSILFSLANGVSHAKSISSKLDCKVLDAAIYILSNIQSPGVIRKKGRVFNLIIGSKTYQQELLTVESLFKQAGLRIKIAQDIQEALWKKYLFISVFATLTSFYDESIKDVYDNHLNSCKTLLEEFVLVAKAEGVELNQEIDKALNTASKLPQEATTSMHLDFQHSHKNELETLTHYVIEEGLKSGIETPLYKEMYIALKERRV